MAGLLLYRELRIEDRLPSAGLQELQWEIQAEDRFDGCPGSSVLLGDSLTAFYMLKFS